MNHYHVSTRKQANSAIEGLGHTDKNLNSICIDCKNKECKGTYEQVWTGCIYRK